MKAVQGKVEIYADGGCRRGTDVFKALALGAQAVFIGRPVLWGLCYNVRERGKFLHQLASLVVNNYGLNVNNESHV